MSSERHNKISDLFRAACELPPHVRAAFLDEACAGDTRLRAEVETLLAQDDQHPSFLENAAPDKGQAKPGRRGQANDAGRAASTVGMKDSTRHPQRIGSYKILDVLGEGGMGIVYLAEQTEPVRRQVALKLIKLGMDTKQVLARLESERQALALMNHPNVAKLLDAGASEPAIGGRPYFVMEHVHGVPITEYCDRYRLSTTDRLRLFMQVCQAVQHAHQKGIIHRDIKPSNVLVAVEGDKPVPKVIDFGVAKATQHKLTERTLFTEQGQMIGTPEYMSPEQAEMTALDIDTRTDIYSLGVLLYELLVGALPFDPTSLRQAAFAEIQRIIREVEPPKPSTRLSSLGDESTTAAQKRHTNRTSLERQLRGDLDWITMKAIEKDRTRRYATAAEFADDVARHLRHEPVLASPPSAAYRARKFIRRNKGPVAIAAVFVLLISASAVSLGFLYNRAEQNLALAEQRENEANEASDQAQRQTAIAQAVNDFLNEDLLAAVAPDEKGREVTVREVLDAASENIEGKFTDEPLVEASIRLTLANTYWRLGEYEAAERHAAETLRLRRAVLGDEHPDTLNSMNTLAVLYKNQGRYDEAEPLYIKTLATLRSVVGDEDPATLSLMSNLATLLGDQGKLQEAEALQREALAIRRRVLGDDDPKTLMSMANLTGVLSDQGKLDEAEALYHETLATRRRVLGESHPDTLQSMNNLAKLLVSRGRLDEAEPLYRRTLETGRRVLGDEHPHIATIMSNFAMLLAAKGEHDDAAAMCREALTIRRQRLGEEHWRTANTRSRLGKCLTMLGRYDEAEQELLAAYRTLAATLGKGHTRTIGTVEYLEALYEAWGKPEQAASWRARLTSANSSAQRSNQDE